MEAENEKFIDGIAEKKMELFIGENAEYYLDKWNSSENPKKKAGWNWAAALCGLLWLGYRKMYNIIMQIVVLFLVFDAIKFYLGVDLDSSIGIILAVVLGMLGNSLYYKHMLKEIENINGEFSDSARELQELKKVGGRSWGGVALTIIIISVYVIISGYIFGF